MTIVYDKRRPEKGYDDSDTAYEVNVDLGWVNVEQTSKRFAKDSLTAMTPDDAEWLAARLLEAAAMARQHDRWKPGFKDCRTSIAGPRGECHHGTPGCVTHKERLSVKVGPS